MNYSDYNWGDDEPMIEPVGREPLIQQLVQWLVVLTFLTTAASCLLVAILGDSTLRQQPYRLLQSLVALAAVAETVLSIVMYTPEFVHRKGLLSIPVICSVSTPLLYSFYWMVPFSILLASVDRMHSLVKGEVNVGFSKKCGMVAIILVIVFAFTLSFGTIFGIGGPNVHHLPHGISYCTMNMIFYHVINFTNGIFVLLVVIAALILVVILCKVRCHDKNDFPLDNVLPVIIGNIIWAAGLVMASLSGRFFLANLYLDSILLTVMMLVWLFGDGAVRAAFVGKCCPCCPAGADEESAMLLDPAKPK